MELKYPRDLLPNEKPSSVDLEIMETNFSDLRNQLVEINNKFNQLKIISGMLYSIVFMKHEICRAINS
jgi:hypothetical protein